ncbi:pre-toxin TG domain-containing protein [Rummeliibacillus sp. G93]|uniref:pre-toxin TG domain-containing protein n=1 Tax=Rummeliibacillus sp. G93 TaxID=2939494 RepID=UPI00201C9333|nr:pre-toxin TG domain-containing protein [Rummeliibacillus sp. G93]UQW98014.1 pre-toxin TG domain-containing protein [Rummeliibacillus sp. G93]
MKIHYEEAKWKSIASALEKVNEAHKYDNKYEHADDLFKDSKSEIADKDIDGAISFSPQTYQPEANPIREKYKKLYNYAKGIGKIIDEKVDEPFYKSIDEYMQKMADMNVSAYTTANTINVQTGPFFNRHDKKEIKLTDLYEADTEYSENLKAEYEAWKLQNPDVKSSQEDYETAALNSGAFEYEGIRAGQEKKEFWFNLIATGVVVGLTIVCPPAGLVAGAAYTAIDVGGAITGEDLISGRKLSDNERLVRGAFAIVPGAGAAAGKALLKNMPALANVMKSAYKTVENAGGSALKSTQEHARNLGKAHGNQLKFTLKHPVLAAVTSKTGQQTVRQSAKFIDNALRPIEVRAVQTTVGNVVTGVERGLPSGKLPAKADEYLAIKQAEKDGVLADKGTSKSYGNYSTAIDDKVEVIEKVDLAEWISESFTDCNYRTVITKEKIIFYRTYGGGARATGSFVTTSPAGNRINAKTSTALVPDWKNTREFEAVIEVPKGQVLNIGKVEKQYTKSGALLEGNGDQILLPQDWPSEWIKEIRKVPSR